MKVCCPPGALGVWAAEKKRQLLSKNGQQFRSYEILSRPVALIGSEFAYVVPVNVCRPD